MEPDFFQYDTRHDTSLIGNIQIYIYWTYANSQVFNQVAAADGHESSLGNNQANLLGIGTSRAMFLSTIIGNILPYLIISVARPTDWSLHSDNNTLVLVCVCGPVCHPQWGQGCARSGAATSCSATQRLGPDQGSDPPAAACAAPSKHL